jgi:Tol biopolymer transport system component
VDLPVKEGGYDIYLTDISGRTVRQWRGVQERQLKVNALRPGIYLLDIRQPGTGKRVVEKLTVQ